MKKKEAKLPPKTPRKPRVCATPGCGHLGYKHVGGKCLAKVKRGIHRPCECTKLDLPPKPKRALLKPWERKVKFRPLGRVGSRWALSLREGGTRAKAGVFVLYDLVRERVFSIGSHPHNATREALRRVRTSERCYPNLVQEEPLLSRGAAALWFAACDDEAERLQAVALLFERFGVKKEAAHA